MKLDYTGIGARKTPKDTLLLMEQIAIKLRGKNRWLRTGGARGADQAFMKGALDEHGFFHGECYIPWVGFEDLPSGICTIPWSWKEAKKIAAAHHPAWDKLTDPVQLLHARNVFQVLGAVLKQPSAFLICWTPEGKTIGGTATAIRIAETYKVPVFNLANEEHKQRLLTFVNS